MDSPQNAPIPGKKIKPFDPINFLLSRVGRILQLGFIAFLLLSPLVWLNRNPYFQANGSLLLSPTVRQVLSKTDRTIHGSFLHFAETQSKRMTTDEVLLAALESIPIEDRPLFLSSIKDPEVAAAALRGRLNVRPVPNSYLMFLSLSDSSSEGLAETINAVMQAYVSKLEREQERQSQRRLDYLAEEKGRIHEEIKEKQGRQDELASQLKSRTFNEFKNPYFDSVVTMQNQYLLAKSEQIENQSKVAHAESSIEAIGKLDLDVFADEAVARNEAVYLIDNWTYTKLQELRGKIDGLTPTNPDRVYVEERMAAMEDYLSNFKEELNADFLKILTETRNFELNKELVEAKTTHEASELLTNKLEEAWLEAEKLFRNSTELIAEGIAINDEIEQLRQRVSVVSDSIRHVTLDSKSPTHVQIEERSLPPNAPSSDNLIKVIGMIFAAAFGFAGASCLLLEILDARVRSNRDIAIALGTSAPDSIPAYFGNNPENWETLCLKKAPTHPASAAIQKLVVKFNRERIAEHAKTFLFTPAQPNFSATSLARNVAVGMTRYSNRILYFQIAEQAVDKPLSNEVIPTSSEEMVEWLKENVIWVENVAVVTVSETSKLHQIRAALLQLVQVASSQFDALILDAPALIESDLSQFLCDHVDTAVIVAEDRKTLYPSLRATVELLYQAPIKSFTAVLTGAHPSPLEGILQWRNDIFKNLKAPTIPGLLHSIETTARSRHHTHLRKRNPLLKLGKFYRKRQKSVEKNTANIPDKRKQPNNSTHSK